MNEYNEPFSPQRVDESIEEILTTGQPSLPGQWSAEVDVRLVKDLQHIYGSESTHYQQVLQRVEERLVQQRGLLEKINTGRRPPLRPLPAPQEQAPLQAQLIQRGNRKNIMDDKKTGFRRMERSLSLLVAVIILAVLVGGFFVAQSRFAQLSGSSPNNPKVATSPTPTKPVPSPTPKATGNNTVTIPGDQMGFQNISWSNDGERLVSTTDNGIRIWDATTGKVTLAVKLPGVNEWGEGLSWSPDNKLIAIGTNQALHIVDSQSGAVVRTYTTQLTSTPVPGAMSSLGGGSHFSTLFPASGGWGFRAVAWSPDGSSIAVSVSTGPSGFLQMLNAQTATLKYTLPNVDDSVSGQIAWSSDGQYLAVSGYSTQGGDPATSSKVWVWDVAKRAITLQKTGSENGGTLAFQPKTHNLTVSIVDTSNQITTQVWDVTIGKQINSYGYLDQVTWSPDGQQLAYTAYTKVANNTYETSVKIINASNGDVLHEYKVGKWQVSQLSWSPDGKHMLSIESQTIINQSNGTPSATPLPMPFNRKVVARIWTIA